MKRVCAPCPSVRERKREKEKDGGDREREREHGQTLPGGREREKEGGRKRVARTLSNAMDKLSRYPSKRAGVLEAFIIQSVSQHA